MIWVLISLSMFVTHASLSTDTNNNVIVFFSPEDQIFYDDVQLKDQLYNSVLLGDYKNAVLRAMRLESTAKGELIKSVVDKLLFEGRRNIVEFAYCLWNTFGSNIVISYFPREFRMILSESPVVIINKKDELALKLEYSTDSDGDRKVFGDKQDKTSERVNWKLYPIWERNRVYFLIQNIQRHQYMKLEVRADDVGDRKAFGADQDDTHRHQWYLHSVYYNGQVLFYIINRNYNQALKLGRYVDRDGDRQLWGHNGNAIGTPEDFGWHIMPY